MLANIYQFTCIHLLAVIQFKTIDNNTQQMDAYELVFLGWQTSVFASSLKLDGIASGYLMIIVFWNSFDYITHLFNEP